MYFDLNVPIPQPSASSVAQSNKGKGKKVQSSTSQQFTSAQLIAIEARVDLLVHRVSFSTLHSYLGNTLIGGPVGYSVLAFNQCIKSKIEPKTFINTLDPLLCHLKKRPGVVYLKRLTIVLDEDSEKGFGLVRSYFPCHQVASLTQRPADKCAVQSV